MGRAGLPADGMMQLPKQIIENSNLKINFNKHLKKIEDKQAFFEDGSCEKFDKIVLALPFSEIKKITKTPIVAIGGINADNYKKLLLNKANFLAISGYIWKNKKLKPKDAIEKLI